MSDMDEMTHNRTVERLPWLVNGTLDADERREVEEHLADCASCRRELAATREAFDLYSAHLPPELLTAYAEAPDAESWKVGGGPDGPGAVVERDVVEAHLDHCNDCRDDLALVRESRAALGLDTRSTGTSAPGEAEASTPVLPFTPDRRTAGDVDPSAPPVAIPGPRRWPWVALAASILLALVTAGLWWTASQQLDQRQARVEILEQRLADLQQALEDEDAAAGATDPGAAPGAIAAEDVEAMERLVAEMEDRLAALEGSLASERQQVAQLQDELAAGRRFELDDDDVMLVRELYQGVVRGDEPAADELPVVDTDRRKLVVFEITLEGEVAEQEAVPYRVVDAGGTVLRRGELTPEPPRDAFAGPYLLLSLTLDGLPPGELELRLLAGDGSGRVAMSVPFRVR